jgi:hypothetical protein
VKRGGERCWQPQCCVGGAPWTSATSKSARYPIFSRRGSSARVRSLRCFSLLQRMQAVVQRLSAAKPECPIRFMIGELAVRGCCCAGTLSPTTEHLKACYLPAETVRACALPWRLVWCGFFWAWSPWTRAEVDRALRVARAVRSGPSFGAGAHRTGAKKTLPPQRTRTAGLIARCCGCDDSFVPQGPRARPFALLLLCVSAASSARGCFCCERSDLFAPSGAIPR